MIEEGGNGSNGTRCSLCGHEMEHEEDFCGCGSEDNEEDED